jgi:sec-independent protein translocase protein TatB
MFDVAPSEFLLVAFVALVVIGPKDLPKAMRVVGYWVGKARGVARQFRSGFDSMVREAELEEMEKRWASENERIMREHPQTDTAQVVHSPEADAVGDTAADSTLVHDDHSMEPVMVEKPVVAAAEHSSVVSTSEDNAAVTRSARDHSPDLFDTKDVVVAHPIDQLDTNHHQAGHHQTVHQTGKPDVAPS